MPYLARQFNQEIQSNMRELDGVCQGEIRRAVPGGPDGQTQEVQRLDSRDGM